MVETISLPAGQVADLAAPSISTPPTDEQQSVAAELRKETIGVRLKLNRFGTLRALPPKQQGEAAETFSADARYVRTKKKLLNPRRKEYRSVTQSIAAVRAYWQANTIVYPAEAGVRLMRKAEIPAFEKQMQGFRDALTSRIMDLDGALAGIVDQARTDLGDLFDASDYPASFSGQFDFSWEYTTPEPPDYLAKLSPAIYERECARVKASFDLAVQLTEAAFAEELAGLVSSLAERLTPSDDGKPKVLRDSAVENFGDFFQRVSKLNVRSNNQLEALMHQCQQLVGGVKPDALRKDGLLRDQLRAGLSEIKAQLGGLVEVRSRRFRLENEGDSEMADMQAIIAESEVADA